MEYDINEISQLFEEYKKILIELEKNPSDFLKEKADGIKLKYNALWMKLGKILHNLPLPYIDEEIENSLRHPIGKKLFKHLVELSVLKKKNLDQQLIKSDIIQPKLDGISIIFWNFENKIYMVSRGDRNYGYDYTESILKHHPILFKLIENFFKKNKKIYGIRGEILLPIEYIDEKKPYLSQITRILNSKNPLEEIKYLDFIAYEIFATEEINYLTSLKLLAKNKIIIPAFTILEENILLNIENFNKLFKLFINYKYNMDGIVVIRSNGIKMAFKNLITFHTKIKEIQINIKNSLNIVPVIQIEDIYTNNKRYSSLNMSNLNKLIKYKLRPGDMISCQLISGGFLKFHDILNKTNRSETMYIKWLMKNIMPYNVIYENGEFIIKDNKNTFLIFLIKLSIIGWKDKKIKKFLNTHGIALSANIQYLDQFLMIDDDFITKVRNKIMSESTLFLTILSLTINNLTFGVVSKKLFTNYFISYDDNGYIENIEKKLLLLDSNINKKIDEIIPLFKLNFNYFVSLKQTLIKN